MCNIYLVYSKWENYLIFIDIFYRNVYASSTNMINHNPSFITDINRLYYDYQLAEHTQREHNNDRGQEKMSLKSND